MRRNKLLVTVTSLALAAGCVPVTAGAAEQKGMQNYIVSTAAVEKLEKTYVTTDTISGQGEDLAQKHDLAMVALTADQKETLKKDAKSKLCGTGCDGDGVVDITAPMTRR